MQATDDKPPVKITDFEHLRTMALDHENEFFMLLGPGGIARSGKGVRHYPEGDWDVRNDIDDSYSDYDSDEDFKAGENLILEAIDKGAFYMHPRYTDAEKKVKFRQYLQDTGQG